MDATGSYTPGLAPELAEVLLSESTLQEIVHLAMDAAIKMVPEVEAASITMVSAHNRPVTARASSELVRAADEAQYRAEQGPCLHAMATGQEVTAEIPTDRWPAFSATAFDAGLRRVWSLPLTVGGRHIGALNLYSVGEEPAREPGASATRLLAGQVAVVLANASDLADARQATANFRTALNTRTVIAQAQGILMGRQGISADEAFDILRRASQRSNRKLRDVAADMVNGLEHAGTSRERNPEGAAPPPSGACHK
jgi:GAF domain-containing protein